MINPHWSRIHMADTSLEKKRPKSVRGAVFSVQETILRDTKVKLKQNKAQNMYSKNVEMDHTASRSQFTQFLLASHHISFNIRQTKQFLEICKEQAKRSRRPGQPAQEDVISGRIVWQRGQLERVEHPQWGLLSVLSVLSVLYFSSAEQSHTASFSANQVSFKNQWISPA